MTESFDSNPSGDQGTSGPYGLPLEPPASPTGDRWEAYAAPVPPVAMRRRRRTRPLVTGALVVGTVAASAGIGHALWPAGATRTASAPLQSGSAASGSPASGSSSTGSGSGSIGSGSVGSGSIGSGSAGSGSVGSGSGSAGGSGGIGQSPYGSGLSPYGSGTTPSPYGSASGSTEGSGGPSDVPAIAAGVDPALVDINTTFGYQQASGAGTGIVLSSNGEILTNNHVINGATSISVTDLGNGRTYKANVVGYDDTRDVAVLQLVGASGLKTARIDTTAARVGEAVVAIGNAGGTGGTPSAAGGSVTALDQSITASDQLDGTAEKLSGLIEVNADIQAGDSGGSLVNSSGQVIGMDTAAAQGFSLQSAGGQTAQGYAIPINQALSIAARIESGRSSSTVHVGPTAFLGVLISPSPRSGGAGYGYPYGGYGYGYSGGGAASVQGADVQGVVPGGAASAAGIGAGDVITSIDGQAVTTAASLSQAMSTEQPGRTISIGWTDSSGQSHTASVTLTAGPPA